VLFKLALDASLFVEILLLLLFVDFLLNIDDSSRPGLDAPTSDTETVAAMAEAISFNS